MPKNNFSDLSVMEYVSTGLYDRDYLNSTKINQDSQKNADQDIRICKSCNKLFETFSIGQGMYSSYYYEDFPRYGKGMSECAKCRIGRSKKTFFTWHRGQRSERNVNKFSVNYKERSDWKETKLKRSEH